MLVGTILGSGGGIIASGSLAVLLALSRRRSAGLRRQAERLRRIADAGGEGILIHREGIVIDLNQATSHMLGRTADDLRGRHVLDLVAPDSLALVQRRLEHRSAADGDSMEINLLAVGDRHVPAEMVARPIELDGRQAMVVTMRDLSAHRQQQASLRHAAQLDPLTDLPNRALFDQRLARSLAQAAATDTSLAVLRLDLSRRKPIDGQYAADKLLLELSTRLQGHLTGVDTAARLGDNEFAIIQPLTDGLKQAADLALRTFKSLSQPVEIFGQRIAACVSIGVAIFPADAAAADTLLAAADTALQRAKQDGPGRICFFDRGMDRQRQQRRELQQDLAQALERRELQLHYQPLFDCRSGERHGFEALLRWTHPVRGQIPPAELIAAAEAAGLAERIGAWVLETACAEAAGWPSPCCVAVNLMPRQFRYPELPDQVAEVLLRTGLQADRLELEVTEDVLMEDAENALQILESLHDLGVRVALDDFGTGTSSLNSLSRLPVDKVKIDRSFIDGIGQGGISGGAQAAAVIGAVVTLAHNLNLCVIAEGVETPAQLDFVRRRQCDQVQGYLLGPPVPSAALPEIFAGGLDAFPPAPKAAGKPFIRLVSSS